LLQKIKEPLGESPMVFYLDLPDEKAASSGYRVFSEMSYLSEVANALKKLNCKMKIEKSHSA